MDRGRKRLIRYYFTRIARVPPKIDIILLPLLPLRETTSRNV